MIAICAECGYKLLVQFASDAEMQSMLRETGWICVCVNHHWHTVCPECRKEKERAKAQKEIAAYRGARAAVHGADIVGNACARR